MSQEERAAQLHADGWIRVPERLRKSVRAAHLPRTSLKELSLCLAPPWVVALADALFYVQTTEHHYSGSALAGMTARAVRAGTRDPESAVAALRLGGPRALQDYLEGSS